MDHLTRDPPPGRLPGRDCLTFILAYGAYFIAENIHVSGVLAVVAAGMLNGNIGPRAMSPTTRIVVANFWEFTAFIANSLVFLLIGLVVDPLVLVQNWAPILIAIVAVLVSRGIVIYGFSALTRDIPPRWQVILHWGGLKGAISLALALGLGANSQLRALTFGVVLFTLLIQGTTMGPLVRWLGLAVRSESKEVFNLTKARAIATQAALDRLTTMWESGVISEQSWKIISPILIDHNQEMKTEIQNIMDREPEVAREELDNVWREMLRTQRTTLNHLYADGLIQEKYLVELVSGLDAALTRYDISWNDLPGLKEGLALTEAPPEVALVPVD